MLLNDDNLSPILCNKLANSRRKIPFYMRVMTKICLHVHASMHTRSCVCTLFSGMIRPISQQHLVRSEISRYLWNQGNMQEMYENIN